MLWRTKFDNRISWEKAKYIILSELMHRYPTQKFLRSHIETQKVDFAYQLAIETLLILFGFCEFHNDGVVEIDN